MKRPKITLPQTLKDYFQRPWSSWRVWLVVNRENEVVWWHIRIIDARNFIKPGDGYRLMPWYKREVL